MIQAGDTVYARSGYHGALELGSGSYQPVIAIIAEQGHTPQLSRLRVGASGVSFSGLSISPSHAPDYETVTIVEIEDGSARVTVERCEVFSEDDAGAWGASDWIDRASSGFEVSGEEAVVRANRIRNVRFGISVGGANALIEHNTIDGFSADGLRGLGDYGVFQYNVVKNVYVDGDMDDNHDDGFQSWSVGPDGVGTGEVRGVVLRGNLILNYEDPAQPFRATLQGIGCFDGTFVDWVVENNVVITDHWHGITLLGARSSRIVNNTVLDVNDETPGPPWISIDAHKDGTAPEGCVVRNNLATDFTSADTVTEDHNTVIEDAAALFVDVAGHDLHLREGAAVIDQGGTELAPALDADRIARPQGAGIDLGAYEWHEPGVQPIDGGAPAGGAGGSAGMRAGAGGAGRGGAGASGRGGSPSSGAGGSGMAGAAEDAGAHDAGGSSGANDDVDGGCGCRIAAAPSSSRAPVLFGLVLSLALARRRTRR